MMPKRVLTSFVLFAAPLAAGSCLASNANAATNNPQEPEVFAVDAAGHPINDVVFGGVVETRTSPAAGWNDESLDGYSFTRMYGRSNTAAVFNGSGTGTATQNGGLNASIASQPTEATSCADATMRMTINQEAAPKGYSVSPGSITVCQTVNGWVEQANTTNGGITFTSAPATQVPHIVIHEKKLGKGQTNQPGPTVKGGDGSSLPSVAKVRARHTEYGVSGMRWDALLKYDSDGDGVKDTTIDLAKAEGVSEAAMGDMSYSDEMWQNIPWDVLDSSKATSCANSPAELTVWETAAPTGYQKIDQKATVCLIGGSWVQTATPDDSTGWIKYDNAGNLFRFGEYRVAATPPHTDPHKPSKPHTPSKPGTPSKPVVTVIPGPPAKSTGHHSSTVPGPGKSQPSPSTGTPAQGGSQQPATHSVMGPKVSTDHGVTAGNNDRDFEMAAALLALGSVAAFGVRKARQ